MLSNPEKRFLATRDDNQLAPICQLSVRDKTAYYDRIIDQLFPVRVRLSVNKRCRSPADRAKILQVCQELKAASKRQCVAICKKYFKVITNTKQMKSYHNVSFTRETRDMVNNICHAKVLRHRDRRGDDRWHPGLEVICSKPYRNKQFQIHLGCRYTVHSVGPCIEFGDGYCLPRKVFDNHFRLPYCSTCHSLQGDLYC